MSPPITGAAHLDITMALLASVGGVFGYARKNSLPSLIGGLGVGCAYALTAHYIMNVDAWKGHAGGLATSIALTAIMGSRAIKTKKLMPAGLMAGLGLGASGYHLVKLREWS